MKLTEPTRRLRIYTGDAATWRGKTLYHVLVLKARKMGLAGATVWRCIEGFGPKNHIKTAKILALSSDLPVIIEVVDNADAINQYIEEIKDMVSEGMITLEDTKVLKYGDKENIE